jgi:hypothetical protein
MPLSKSFAREPADFYGLPVAFLQTPSDERVSKMGPTTRTIRPASGSCCRGQAEPVSIDDRSITNRASRPILPWAFVVFSRVCWMLFHSTRFCTGSSSSWCERRQSPQPCLSWAAIRSWVCGQLLQGSALGLLHSYDRARGDIPAVAGPSAYSGDLRLVDPSDLEAVTTDHGDVLPFRIDIPSEVFAPSGGAF